MCLILCSPNRAQIDPEFISNGWAHGNSDGAGCMWLEGGIVEFRKGFFELDELLRFVKTRQQKKGVTNFAVHLRYATHGYKNADNCHPFITTFGTGVMHNGILDVEKYMSKNGRGSDTKFFVEVMMERKRLGLTENWIKDDAKCAMIDKLTTGSRMLYLTPTLYRYTGGWVKKHGLLFSNWQFEPPVIAKIGMDYGYKEDFDCAKDVYYLNPDEYKMKFDEACKVQTKLWEGLGVAVDVGYSLPSTNDAFFRHAVSAVTERGLFKNYDKRGV